MHKNEPKQLLPNEPIPPRYNDKPLVTLSQDMIATADKYGDIERVVITRAQNRNYGLGEGFHLFADRSDTWRLVLRYKAQTRGDYNRAKEDLHQSSHRSASSRPS
jgi:hypothetical protein